MSTIKKYAALPDLDPSPDIYETPELTDDNSTHLTSTTLQSNSAYDDQGEDEGSDIDRQRLDPDEARTHFLSANERDHHKSSRVGLKRVSYRSSDRRKRKDRENGNGIITGVELSSDDEGESLDRRIARLRREIAEVKEEFERNQDQKEQEIRRDPGEAAGSLDSLSTVLEDLSPPTATNGGNAASRLVQGFASKSDLPSHLVGESESKTTPQYEQGSPHNQDIQALSRVSDFESRLVMLEAALGLDNLPLATQDKSLTKPVLPNLDALNKQLSTLSTATDTSLDTISRKVRQLTQDTEKLERARKSAKAAEEALRQVALSPTSPSSNTEAAKKTSVEPFSEDPEMVSKINALYGTLSTIESLAPMLPSVLDRLRSLRSLHAEAATASETLNVLESRQDEMREELQGWRTGLEKVEKAMELGELAMKDNTEVVEGWVKELEKRMETFGQ